VDGRYPHTAQEDHRLMNTWSSKGLEGHWLWYKKQLKKMRGMVQRAKLKHWVKMLVDTDTQNP
jgi:hypothetical protein